MAGIVCSDDNLGKELNNRIYTNYLLYLELRAEINE